jgi:hypothetical protein
MIDLTQKIDGIVLNKSCKCREDEGSKIVKTLHLKVTFTGTLQGVFHKALVPVVIAVQGKVRKNWNKYTDGQTVEISFVAPTVTEADPVDLIVLRAAAAKMTVEEYLKAEIAKRTPPTLEPLK